MAGEATPERPTATEPGTASGLHHTRWLLIALYGLAFAWGARNVHFWEPTRLDLLLPTALALVLGWWAIADARWRRHPIPVLARPWFFLAAGLLVPGYVIWSRRWPGVGWLVLHAILWYALATAVMHVGGVIVFGRQWLRGLGL